MTSTHEDEGFEALLRPIQDLTRNWDVDLSSHLEEYMNYIRQICGDDIPVMNFVKAALLVQNSTNIYCKKVDLLFTTVVQLVESLTKKHILLDVDEDSSKPKRKPHRHEVKDGDSQDGEEVQSNPGVKKRKVPISLETEDFTPLKEVCSDRPLTLNYEKEKQKAEERGKNKIVLNAAIKVKAKEKTSCNVYHCGQDVMGKKDEFRLNWRMCSAGTLHEEFVINRNRFKSMEPVNITVYQNDDAPVDGDSIHHDYDDHFSHHSLNEDKPAPDDELPNTINSIFSAPPIDRESEDHRLAEIRKRKEVIKTLPKLEWQENDFDVNIIEKPIKKRKVFKIPVIFGGKGKRKIFQNGIIFTIIDVIFIEYKNNSFNRDTDFSFLSKHAVRHKRHLLLQHREKYQAYLEKEAGIDQIDEFPGFYNEDQDSENDHDFEGFGDIHDDGDAVDVDVPYPEKDIILDHNAGDVGWKGDDTNSYNNEAMRTIQAFRSRKIDYERKTDMARRVAEWHQKIAPKLEAAEERSSFDIHEYGSKILSTFSEEVGSVKSFAEIVAGQPREEVARYFLSSLVLANQYNVEISETEPGDLNVDCVQLKLLSTSRHRDEMDDNLRQTTDK